MTVLFDLLKSPSRRIFSLFSALVFSSAVGMSGVGYGQGSAANRSQSSREATQGLPSQFPSPTNQAGIRHIQEALQRAGVLVRRPNGRWDNATRDALRRFQASKGLPANGRIHQATWDALLAEIRRRATQNQRGPNPSATPPASSSQPLAQISAQETVGHQLRPLVGSGGKPITHDDDFILLPLRAERTALGGIPRVLSAVNPGDQAGTGSFVDSSGLVMAHVMSFGENPGETKESVEFQKPDLTSESESQNAGLAEEEAESDAVVQLADIPVSEPVKEPRSTHAVSTDTGEFLASDRTDSRALSGSPAPVLSLEVRDSAGPQKTPAGMEKIVPKNLELSESAKLSDDLPELPISSQVEVIPNPTVAPGVEMVKLPLAEAKASGETTLSIAALRIAAPPPARDPREEAARRKEFEELVVRSKALVLGLESEESLNLHNVAPERIASLRALAQRIQEYAEKNSASALSQARHTMVLLEEESASAISAAAQLKAAGIKERVETIHQRLRTRWAQAARRGRLANDMAAADRGVEKMKEDYQAGRFEPIALRGDGFILVLEKIENAAARNWIEFQLADAGVRRRLGDSRINKISLMQAQGNHVKAADFLQETAGDSVRPMTATAAPQAAVPSRTTQSRPRTNQRTRTTNRSSRNRSSSSTSSNRSGIVIQNANPSNQSSRTTNRTATSRSGVRITPATSR